jgi:hypothetical protein
MAEVRPVKGGERLDAYLAKLSKKVKRGATMRVGFLENATYPDGTPVAEVAAIQNFGAPVAGIPPRPFFSTMVNREAGGWGVKLSRILEHAEYDSILALNLLGEGIAGQLRQAIVDMNDPALSPVTLLLRERFSDHDSITFADVQKAREDIAAGVKPNVTATQAKPLVWTGHMLASIGVEVTEGPVNEAAQAGTGAPTSSPAPTSRPSPMTKTKMVKTKSRPDKIGSKSRRGAIGGVYDEAAKRGGR